MYHTHLFHSIQSPRVLISADMSDDAQCFGNLRMAYLSQMYSLKVNVSPSEVRSFSKFGRRVDFALSVQSTTRRHHLWPKF